VLGLLARDASDRRGRKGAIEEKCCLLPLFEGLRKQIRKRGIVATCFFFLQYRERGLVFLKLVEMLFGSAFV